jgi:hypothetical protein
MKKIIGLVFLSLLAISATAADLIASSAPPVVTQNIVVEGAACPGVGATGFSSTGLLLSCQSGIWTNAGGARSIFGGTYTIRLAGNNYNGMMPLGCSTVNPATNSCSCNSGFIASEIGRGGYYHYAAWDTLYIGYICTKDFN